MSIEIAKVEGLEGFYTASDARNLFNETGEKRQYLCGICEIPILQKNVEKSFEAEIFRAPHFSTPKGERHLPPCDGSLEEAKPGQVLGREMGKPEQYPSRMLEAVTRRIVTEPTSRVPLTPEQIAMRKKRSSPASEARFKRGYSFLLEFVSYYRQVTKDHSSFTEAKKPLSQCNIEFLNGQKKNYAWAFRKPSTTVLKDLKDEDWIFYDKIERVQRLREGTYRVELTPRRKEGGSVPVFCDVVFEPHARVAGYRAHFQQKLRSLVGKSTNECLYVCGKLHHGPEGFEILALGSSWHCIEEAPRTKSVSNLKDSTFVRSPSSVTASLPVG
jgi:hypothetical protein